MTVYESGSTTASNETSINTSTIIHSQTNKPTPAVSPIICDGDQTGGQTSVTESITPAVNVTGTTTQTITPIYTNKNINVTLSVLPINPIEIYSNDFLDQTTVLKTVQIQIQLNCQESYGYLNQIIQYIKSNTLYSFIRTVANNLQNKYKDNDIYISTIDISNIIQFKSNESLFLVNLKIYFTSKKYNTNTNLNTRIDNTINFGSGPYNYDLTYITYTPTNNQGEIQTDSQGKPCTIIETTTLYISFINSCIIIPVKYIYGSTTQTQTNTNTNHTPESDNINENVNILNHIIVQTQNNTNEQDLGIPKNKFKTYYFDLNNLQYQIYLSSQKDKEKELNFNINVLLRNNFSLSNFKIDQSSFLPKYIQQYFTGNYDIFKDSLPVIFNNEIVKDSKYTKGYIKSTKQYVAVESEKQHLIDKFEVYPYKIYKENTLNRTEDTGYYLDFDKSYFKKICQNIENTIMTYSFYYKRISKINNIDIKTALKYNKNILGLIPLLRFPIVNVNKSLVDNNILIKKSKVSYKEISAEMYKEMYRYFGNIDIPFKKIVNKIKNVYSLFNPFSTNQYKIFDNENIYRDKSNKIIPLTYDNQYRSSEEIYIDQYNKCNPDNPNLPLSIEYTNFNDSKFYNLDTTIELCDNLYRTKREISLLNEKSYLIDLFTEYLSKSNIKNYHWIPDEILFLFNKYTYKKVEIPMIINHVTNNKFYILKYTLELI